MYRTLVSLFIALIASNAMAATDTVYPVSICQGQTSTERSSSYASYGAQRNSGSSSISFDCPILNLSPDDCSMSVTANVLDLTTSGRVSCSVYARSLSAGSSSSTDYDTEYTVTADVHSSGDALSLTGISCTDKLVHMVCSVPAKSSSSYSGVVSYEVVTD